MDGVTVLSARAVASNADALREIGDWLRDKMGSGVVVLGSVINERPMLVAMVTPDLVASGLNASAIAQGAAKEMGGGGGGRPDVAQAGGRLVDKLDDALELVPALVRESRAGGNAARWVRRWVRKCRAKESWPLTWVSGASALRSATRPDFWQRRSRQSTGRGRRRP